MKTRWAIPVALTLAIAMRAYILLQHPYLTYEAYETLLHIEHISHEGLPLFQRELIYGGVIVPFLPVFHYLLAFISIAAPAKSVALIIPNILASLTAIPAYLLATQVTRNRFAQGAATIASVFAPLLYSETLFSASPISLALPLFLLSYYYFIRLGRTPKYQIRFIVITALLALTHPIILLLAAAMIVTVLVTYVQGTRFSKSMAEAALFTTLIGLWINLLVYKQMLAAHGAFLLWAFREGAVTGASLVTLVGVLPLLAGVYAAYHYFSTEKNEAVHSLVALAGVTLLLLVLQLIEPRTGILILSITLILLGAAAGEQYAKARKRSRIPSLYWVGGAVLAVLFLLTNMIPAATLALEATQETVPPAEEAFVQSLGLRQGTIIYWDEKRALLLEEAGYGTPVTQNGLLHPDSARINQELQAATQTTSPIALIETLNKYGVQALITNGTTGTLVTGRCFEQVAQQPPWEAYRIRCVVR